MRVKRSVVAEAEVEEVGLALVGLGILASEPVGVGRSGTGLPGGLAAAEPGLGPNGPAAVIGDNSSPGGSKQPS